MTYDADIREVTNANFGLLIAYVVPGFVLLWGLQPYSATIQTWLGRSTSESAAVAGFLFITILAIGLGMLCSTARWLSIDRILLRRRPPVQQWDFRQLHQQQSAFDRLIEDHFRYYQFHANGLISLNVAFLLIWCASGIGLLDIFAIIVVDALLWAGAVDTFLKYHDRVDQILGRSQSAFSDRKEFADLDI